MDLRSTMKVPGACRFILVS